MTVAASESVHGHAHHHHREHAAMFTFGMKISVAILISLFLLVAIWCTAPSTLPPARLSAAQLQAFLSSPEFFLGAHRPLNAPPQPPDSVAMNANQQEFDEFVGVPIGAPQDSPSSERLFNSSRTDDSYVNPLTSPVSSPLSDSVSSKHDYSPSPSPTPCSNNSCGSKPLTDDEIGLLNHTKAPGSGPAPGPVKNESSSSPGPATSADPSSESSSKATPLEDDILEPEAEQLQHEGPRFMFPMLSGFVGTGNQLMEYKSAAVIARTLNRTLCLVPFFGGPQRHFGYLGSNHYGLHIEDRYDLKEFSRFVKFADIDECIQKCNGTIDRVWKLRSSRYSDYSYWFPRVPTEAVTFDRQYGKWSSSADIVHGLGQLNEEPGAKCVGMGGVFPGLRWRGAMWAASAFMVHGQKIRNASDVFQARALGSKPYISVHWRFEESNCVGHSLGLCFTRCGDGALIGGGLKSPRYMELPTVMGNFHAGARFRGAGLTKEDIAAALYDKVVEQGVGSVYLSTDGWLRGNESKANIRWVVEDIRRRGLNVSGLWEIEGLPNFADGTFVTAKAMPNLFGLSGGQKVSNHMIALVEQRICARSVVFLGSGQSSWSLAVFDARQSRRRRLELEESVRSNHTGSPLPEVDFDDAVIDNMYKDKHAAGPACNGIRGGTPETFEDEAPDGWLDYEACEKRIDLGGKCVRLISDIAGTQ